LPIQSKAKALGVSSQNMLLIRLYKIVCNACLPQTNKMVENRQIMIRDVILTRRINLDEKAFALYAQV